VAAPAAHRLTDVDVFGQLSGPRTPGTGSHVLIQSFDGGRTLTTPRSIFSVVDTGVFFDAVLGSCVMDGVAGAQDDLSGSAQNNLVGEFLGICLRGRHGNLWRGGLE
jgi:hypothetical protein